MSLSKNEELDRKAKLGEVELSTANIDRKMKLGEEIIKLRADMSRLKKDSVTCIKGDTFWFTLYGGTTETFCFPSEIADEVVNALFDICLRRYQQSTAEFDKMVIPEE